MARLALAAALAPLLLLCGLARPAVPEAGTCAAKEAVDDSTVNLLQVTAVAKSGNARVSTNSLGVATDAVAAESICTPLINRGAWFSVKVGVGSPSQYVHLVADTGSNALVVADCRCVTDHGGCSSKHSCFNTTKSTTFSVRNSDNKKSKSLTKVEARVMAYGSGDILVVVASDQAVVGGVEARMNNGVYLMENRATLRVGSDFEGILGLGMPHSLIKSPLFTVVAGIRRFSVCVGDKEGALRFNVPPLRNPMGNIGTIHWGLDFRGMSVGKASEKVLFCTQEDKKPGQETACGAIPDSGTTLMLGPKKQILDLYSMLCSRWPRCARLARKTGQSRDSAFHNLLLDCTQWISEGKGVEEIPSIFMHLAGSQGAAQTLELSPKHFIYRADKRLYKIVIGKLAGHKFPIEFVIPEGKKEVCLGSFGVQEMNTKVNGPIWILGQPLFHQATVSYDNDGKGSISIEREACTKCVESGHADSKPITGLASVRAIEDIRTPGIAEGWDF